jgi:hypothetical protein
MVRFPRFKKKGIVFSIISVLIVLSFGLVVSFMVTEVNYQADDSFVYKAESLNQYYSLLKTHYLPRILSVTSRVAMEEIIKYEITNGKFIDKGNLTLAYQDLIKDGNYSGVSPYIPIDYALDQTKTLDYWTAFFEDQAIILFNLPTINTSGGAMEDPINITPLYSTFTLEQTSPWEVMVTTYFNISVDAGDFKISDEMYEIKTSFSILDLEDPLYGVHADTLYPINFTNYTRLVNEWDQEELEDALDSYIYFHSSRAPCFLMRLQNISESADANSDCTPDAGIESFLHPDDIRFTGAPFESYNISARKKSYIDFMFFDDTMRLCAGDTDPLFYLYGIEEISNTSDYLNFRLDLNSTTQYLGSDFFSSNTTVVCGNQDVSYN